MFNIVKTIGNHLLFWRVKKLLHFLCLTGKYSRGLPFSGIVLLCGTIIDIQNKAKCKYKSVSETKTINNVHEDKNREDYY